MVSLTFTTTCFNRSYQLMQVYYENLVMYENNPCVDFVLVNFHGEDHEQIDNFIFDKCIRFLFTQKLKYFKRNEKMTEFHISRCKNISHFLSTGDMIYNLDGDNILNGTEYDTVCQEYAKHGPKLILHQCDGPSPLTHEMFQYLKLFSKDYHTLNLMFNGTCGRICTSQTVFKEIGGYNERFHFMGMDDIDFLARCIKGIGCHYIHEPLKTQKNFLPNERQDIYEHTNSKNWDTMNRRFFEQLYVNDQHLDTFKDHYTRVFLPSNPKRLFDLTFTTHGYGNHHRHGWNKVRDSLVDTYVHNEYGIILDLFCERTYFWNPIVDFPKDYYHKKPWVGFIHTTVNENPLYSNLQDILEHDIFVESLKYCYGIFVLCPKNKSVLDTFFHKHKILNGSGHEIPVQVLRHPTEIIQNETQFFNPDNFQVSKCPIYHVGWHLRDFSKFYQLDCCDDHIKYLVLPAIYPGTFMDLFVYKSCTMAHLDLSLSSSDVEIVDALDNEAYDTLLQTSIIFNYLIEPSGSNLITECISRKNPIIVNRHESLEFYLGKDYPMFYDTLEDVEKLLTMETIRKAVKHLGNIREMYTYSTFVETFRVEVNKLISFLQKEEKLCM